MLNQFRLGISLAPGLAIILPIFIVTRRFYPGFRGHFRLYGMNFRMASLIVIATICMLVIVDYAYIVSQSFAPTTKDYIESLKELRPTGAWQITLTFVGLCVVVPISEEIIFRGLIQRVFQRNMNGVLAVVLAGVFFGVIHLNPLLLVSMTAFGIFVGFIFLYTRNLSYSILAHSALNAVAFVQLVFMTGDEIEATPSYAGAWWAAALAMLAVFALMRQIKKGASASPKTPI